MIAVVGEIIKIVLLICSKRVIKKTRSRLRFLLEIVIFDSPPSPFPCINIMSSRQNKITNN